MLAPDRFARSGRGAPEGHRNAFRVRVVRAPEILQLASDYVRQHALHGFREVAAERSTLRDVVLLEGARGCACSWRPASPDIVSGG